ncbi:MAG: tetratricopeptide repeat protein [Myxococcales bacterium]|nr:tetratricopeptide repeat protein [Myxococcales bacterium]MCB9648061.1 tetratricopeptide repeat protein [Deltaproteobacteria bacterium]
MATNDKKPTKTVPGKGTKPESFIDKLIAQGKKAEDLTEEEKRKILEEVDRDIEGMTAEDVIKAVERGEIEIEYVDPPNPIDNFTEENFKKFLFGKITWAQLEGMTMEQAYAIAEFGYTMYQQGRYKDARTLFEGLVIGNPYDPYFHAMLGAIYTKLDMHEEAAQEFSIAIELDPEDINSYVNRGELLLQHGEFEYAMEDLKAAIDLDPEGKNPASLRARALAAATAAAIKELIERKEAEGSAEGQARGPNKPAAQPPKK